MSVTCLAPWYGSFRMGGERVGRELAGCEWVGVTCAGGMSELKWIKARTIVVNDLHRDIINMARVAKDYKQWLVSQLNQLLFHPDEISAAQRFCIEQPLPEVNGEVDLPRAVKYFICCWMGRAETSGTDKEFEGNLSLRWTAGGGDSNVRFRSAIKMLDDFEAIARRCTFSVLDIREFLTEKRGQGAKDADKHGIYTDLPFPHEGAAYKIKATEQLHRDAATAHARFQKTRVVIRYYDCPLIRELYPEDRWEWKHSLGRDQANDATKPEVLIVNRI